MNTNRRINTQEPGETTDEQEPTGEITGDEDFFQQSQVCFSRKSFSSEMIVIQEQDLSSEDVKTTLDASVR